MYFRCSGLKVFSTINGHEKIEETRKACGGQGFLRSSGIADLTCSFTEPCTVEGEQVILSLQVGRFLIKSVRQVLNHDSPKGSVEYLLDPAMTGIQSFTSQHEVLISFLKERARRMAFKLESKFSRAQKDGLSFDEATNASAVLSYKAAGCHSSFVTTRNFLEAINKYVDDDKIRLALLDLLELQALVQIKKDLADWIGLVDETYADAVGERVNVLLDLIRPNAVGLVDCFGHADSALKSTLGKYDGKVYEAIYEEAQLSPLNNRKKMVGWEQLKPMLDLDFIQKGIGQRAGVKQSSL